MWSGANLPSILGEMVVALKNASGCTYESAPVAVLMEQYMLNQMLNLLGFKKGEGQMTTGSSNANMIAMMIARNKHNQANNVKEQGLFASPPLVAYVNAESHYSFDKAANILGLGTNQLVKVSVNEQGQMDISCLEQCIQTTLTQGGQPFFIGATLGTTVRGGYDSIVDILPIKKKYNLWLHGDGAWGGSVIMNDELRGKFMPKVEELDSFTMDFHKMLSTNLICNCLLVKQKNLLKSTCADGNTSYVFHNPLDLGVSSLQCARRVDSLKWFLDWKFFKKSGFSKRVMHYYQLIDYAERQINQFEKLVFVSKRFSFNLCFNFVAPSGTDTNQFNLKLRNELFTNSLEMLSIAYINDIFVFRLLITHPEANTQMVDTLLANIITTGERLCVP